MSIKHTFLEYFQQIYIINLPHRKDRKQEIIDQFNKIGINIAHQRNIQFFNGILPNSAGEFQSIGARGCFLSHLSVLRDAKRSNYDRVLILEDDTNFEPDFLLKIELIIENLKDIEWDAFNGNHRLTGTQTIKLDPAKHITALPKDTTVELANFVAFQGTTISDLVLYLDTMLTRKAGDKAGGPMHVDGAYNWINFSSKNYKAFISNTRLCYQRPSKSDIASRWGQIKTIANRLAS